MKRHDLILAALAGSGESADFTPVQVQKLFFLIDREASHLVSGPHFNFGPYDYGPFDRDVYAEIEMLAAKDKVQINSSGRYRTYRLTSLGYKEGQQHLSKLVPHTRTYIQQVSVWVRKLNFAQLVAAIYKKYPDMQVNSIFNG